ncbi:hypothetical protein [Actinomycetospora cinnamomea]|uniref:hypothetical protein n=1 Tax=Actinomycetospora cinnamomea TaxID=663609 RepID=UPI0010577F44|nr:hypothetical protein [Actinomycetospora cinnamomea]
MGIVAGHGTDTNEWNTVTPGGSRTTLPTRKPPEVIEENAMSFLRRRADALPQAQPVAPPAGPVDDTAAPTPDEPVRRPNRAERKARKAEQAAAAEHAARIARAQRRLAQATGPLPVVTPRRAAEDAVASE